MGPTVIKDLWCGRFSGSKVDDLSISDVYKGPAEVTLPSFIQTQCGREINWDGRKERRLLARIRA